MTTHEKIIAAAKEAGFAYWNTFTPGYKAMHDKFYAIAFEDGRQAEREECAKVYECQQDKTVSGGASGNYWKRRATPQDCADAIRARGTK